MLDQSWHIFDCLFGTQMSTENQFAIFNLVLNSWLERPQLGRGYNKNSLDFYDGVIGYVIKQSNKYAEDKRTNKYWYPEKMLAFAELWKYQGVIYRVIEAPKHKIRYHKKIASWTKSVESFNRFNHLSPNSKYTFIIANTGNSYGFDVNKYNKWANINKIYTVHEEEVIFPMDGKFITYVFSGTLKEFKEFVKTLET